MADSLTPWRAVRAPHRAIREDAVSEALFAVNLNRAIVSEGVSRDEIAQDDDV